MTASVTVSDCTLILFNLGQLRIKRLDGYNKCSCWSDKYFNTIVKNDNYLNMSNDKKFIFPLKWKYVSIYSENA